MDDLYDYMLEKPSAGTPLTPPPTPDELHNGLRRAYDAVAHGEFEAIEGYNFLSRIHQEHCGCGSTWIMERIGSA